MRTDRSRTRTARVLPVVCVALIGLSISACSAKITPEGAAKAVTDLVAEQNDFTPSDVSCPDGVEAKVGVTFECEFTGPDDVVFIAHMKVQRIEGEMVLFEISTEPEP